MEIQRTESQEIKLSLVIPNPWQTFDLAKMQEACAQCGIDLDNILVDPEDASSESINIPPVEENNSTGERQQDDEQNEGIVSWCSKSFGIREEQEVEEEEDEARLRRQIRERVSEILTVYVDTSAHGNPFDFMPPSAE